MIHRQQKTIRGLQLSYLESGTGRDLVFFHGGRLRASTFNHTITELSKNYHVIAPDIPGYGNTSKPDSIWSFREYALFFQVFFQKIQLKNPIIIGYSFGGGIAYQLCLLDSTIEKVILVDAAGIEKSVHNRSVRDFQRLIFYLTHLQYILTLLVLIKEYSLFLLSHSISTSYINKIRSHCENSSKYLSLTTMSINIIWAQYDRIYPVEIARKLHSLNKSSTLLIVNENHDWPLYLEDKFVYILKMSLSK